MGVGLAYGGLVSIRAIRDNLSVPLHCAQSSVTSTLAGLSVYLGLMQHTPGCDGLHGGPALDSDISSLSIVLFPTS